MTRKRTLAYLLISIVVGLMLSACAGVAAGKLEAGSSLSPTGPVIQLWQMPQWAVSAETARATTGVAKSMQAYEVLLPAQQHSATHFCFGDP